MTQPVNELLLLTLVNGRRTYVDPDSLQRLTPIYLNDEGDEQGTEIHVEGNHLFVVRETCEEIIRTASFDVFKVQEPI